MMSKFASCSLVALLLAAGAIHMSAQGPSPRLRDSASPSTACADLARLTLGDSTTITSATLVTTGSLAVSPTQTLANLPSFCRVRGVSKPSADSNIQFEMWLPQPENWNGKFLSSGEGGFAGTLNYTRNGLDGGLDELVRRGYATASTDTGHAASDTWWAIGHPERAIDYLYRSKHVVTVAAKGVIAAYYGRQPNHSYFSSCSNGGRQGLLEAQRYPDDFDGFVIGAPWNFQSHSNAGFVWNSQALAAAGAAIPAEKLLAINKAVLDACDANDGLVDGVVADPRKCLQFNPAMLACHGPAQANGAVVGDTNECLTPPQLTALQKIYQGPKNPRTGEAIFPGFATGSEAGWTSLVANRSATGLPNGYFANLVAEDPKWDFNTFNFDSDMAKADEKIGKLGNAISTDYSAAKRRGVKIIQYHGWNDQTLQPAYSPDYYDQVAKANAGLAATQDFYRLFMVPGMTHCYGGPGATSFGAVGQQIPPVRDASHDIQTALENWVERGTAPAQLIATKFTDDKAETRSVKLTRPLCLYPTTPRYKGTGDPNDAANFACVQ
jgi:feruloyl esterase